MTTPHLIKSIGRSSSRLALLLIPLVFACFALSPMAQAVSPPPDGGYSGGNTAEGDLALGSVTSGFYNTAVGIYSLLSVTTGNNCTGVGAGALLSNTADENTATGAGALFSNTTGEENTANGAFALFTNTTGGGNTANGLRALFSNTIGERNTAIGDRALSSNTTGSSNIANGQLALRNNTTGSFNIAIGRDALVLNTTGSSNTANGDAALQFSTGSNNTALGADAGSTLFHADNVICIGAGVGGADVSNTTWIGNVFGVTTQSGTTAPVIVSDTGQLGTLVSSERFKKDINTMDRSSEVILSLRPVTFHYKTDTKGTPQFGLIAEEVAKVNPALVLPDKEGKPYTVRYDQVNAMLLNEFLKEHRKVEQLTKDFESKLARQQKQIDALTTGLQKVSAQLEASKPATQVAEINE